jgi:PAS domain S-box-containing protein
MKMPRDPGAGPARAAAVALKNSQENKDSHHRPKQTGERFRLLVEAVRDYAIFMLDPDGRVSSWNIGAERIKGYSAAEIIGCHFSRFYTEEDIASGKPARELETAAREGSLEDEGWRLRKDGSRFWANVAITALRDDGGRLVGFAKVTRDSTEKRAVHEALQRANRELEMEILERRDAEIRLQESERSLRHLSRHLLRSQDDERKRIGRELHDSVGQYLAMLKMNLDLLKSAAGEPLFPQISECSNLAEECVKEVRTISYLLYPPMLEEMGLGSAIPWYVDGFAQRSGIKTTFEISPDLGRLPRDVELAVFRVLQESLTNVHRHSGSPTVHVRVAVNEGVVNVEVRDKGKGIPPELLKESSQDSMAVLGVGLRGMTERTRQLGGNLEVCSGTEGTTVRASIPCQSDSAPRGFADPAAGASVEMYRTQGSQ